MKKYNITREFKSLGTAELLKQCTTSTGYVISLFRFCDDKILPYLIAVKKDDETIEFKRLFKGAFTYYLDMICCYA